jgi:biopolymer transport protein ExbD
MTTQSNTWRPKPRRCSKLYARIDLTGLRGASLVIFVLFCMFPGPSHTAHGRFPAQLPAVLSASPDPNALRDDALQIGIRRQGDIFLFGNRNHGSIEKVGADDLPDKLHSLLLPGVEHRVYISADSRARYSDVKAAPSGIRDSGISDVTFLVEARRPPPF